MQISESILQSDYSPGCTPDVWFAEPNLLRFALDGAVMMQTSPKRSAGVYLVQRLFPFSSKQRRHSNQYFLKILEEKILDE